MTLEMILALVVAGLPVVTGVLHRLGYETPILSWIADVLRRPGVPPAGPGTPPLVPDPKPAWLDLSKFPMLDALVKKIDALADQVEAVVARLKQPQPAK